ncbi:MAG: co-chaperone GroES [Candidatus Magasanikbacteria bacterium]|nr:co-chaperone GroES [Candidatus Magasanikbacteria bacterium]
MSMNIKPLGDRILVKPDSEEAVTASGIVLPQTMDKEKKAYGTVIAIGTGEEVKKMGLKVGDRVMYKKWGGEEVKLGKGKDEEEYKILYVGKEEDKSDVIAMVE